MSEKYYNMNNHEHITPEMLKIFHEIMLITGHYNKSDGKFMGSTDITFEKTNNDKWIATTSYGTNNVISSANVIKTINNAIDKVEENWKNGKYTIDVMISGTYDDSKIKNIERELKSQKLSGCYHKRSSRKSCKPKFVYPEKMF